MSARVGAEGDVLPTRARRGGIGLPHAQRLLPAVDFEAGGVFLGASNSTPSTVFCPGASVRGAPPSMTTMALAPISPTRVTSAASAGMPKTASVTNSG